MGYPYLNPEPRVRDLLCPTAKSLPWAKIIHDGSSFSLGEHSHVENFVFINAGRLCIVGAYGMAPPRMRDFR